MSTLDKKDRPSLHLVLTVGTGINTKSGQSNLIEGLRTTIKLLDPVKFWLIPSDSDDSIATADLVKDGFAAFTPWSDDQSYLEITRPDSLENCRDIVRMVIAKAKNTLRKNERLIVNPTSGTKQMSAGATLAALDENIGELVFTIGERIDGIVKTGTERLETFEASDYFAEKDFELARQLYRTGSFAAASKILQNYPNRFKAEAALCQCIHFWEQLNYQKALDIAKENKDHPIFGNFLHHLVPLAQDSSRSASTPRCAKDLLASAERIHGRGDYPSALFRACKAYEVGLNSEIIRLSPPNKTDLRSTFSLNFHEKRGCLRSLHAPREILATPSDLKRAIDRRNGLAHQIIAIEKEHSRAAINAVKEILMHISGPTPAQFPKTLENA